MSDFIKQHISKYHLRYLFLFFVAIGFFVVIKSRHSPLYFNLPQASSCNTGWYYYDEELDCYELPSESFVRRLCLLMYNIKNKESDEYNACIKLTKICEDANIGF